MAKNNIQESQQQDQHITIGTQGNNDQPTRLGEMHPDQKTGNTDRSIPNQDRSSASSQQAERNREQNR